MNATMEAKTELQALLDTALRVKNEGLEDRFNMQDFFCGTSCCLAGWHATFRGDRYQEAVSFVWAMQHALYGRQSFDGPYKEFPGNKCRMILFGADRGHGAEALNRQIRAIRWFLHRIEALEEYERIRAMPKRERRRLGIAA